MNVFPLKDIHLLHLASLCHSWRNYSLSVCLSMHQYTTHTHTHTHTHTRTHTFSLTNQSHIYWDRCTVLQVTLLFLPPVLSIPSLFIPHHCFLPLNLSYSSHTSTSTHTHTHTHTQLPCLTFGEVALLPDADLGSVDQVADGNCPPHRGAYPGVTGAAFVHLQQGQIWGGPAGHRHHVVANTICRESKRESFLNQGNMNNLSTHRRIWLWQDEHTFLFFKY